MDNDSKMTDVQSSMGRMRTKPPSLLACISCRRSHLKCDGVKPLCSRCADKHLDCVWMESRRGYRDYRRGVSKDQQRRRDSGYFFASRPPTEPAPEAFVLDANLAAAQPYTYDELFNPSFSRADAPAIYPSTMPALQAAPSTTHMPSPSRSNGSSPTSIPREVSLARADGARPSTREPTDLLDVFYKYFYSAHPFTIPPKLYKQRPNLLTDPVKAAARYIAAHYVPNQNLLALSNATSIIFSDDTPDDINKIQALMIYTCTCFARYEQIPGKAALDNAIEIALEIGLNKHAFALTHAPDNLVIQESFRRTWWTLFMMEGLITAIGGQMTPFRLHSVYCDVPLPGDDNHYNALQPTLPIKSLADFRNRTFSEDTYAYSSFAFAIEAMYIMGAVFSLGPDTFAITDHQVYAIDASISNFHLSLPPTKREVIPSPETSTVDETLLTAHMIINWAAILVHRPRSTLTFIRNHYAMVCTRAEAAGLPALAYASHTSKTLRAANALIQLASVQRSLAHSTPAMICAITTAATVHLPAYAIADSPEHATAIKERLQLGISALGRLAEIWPRAAIAKSQVAGFAREVLTRPSVCVDSTGPGLPNAVPVTAVGGGGGGGLLTTVDTTGGLPVLELGGERVHADGGLVEMMRGMVEAEEGEGGSEGSEEWLVEDLIRGQMGEGVR